jgi:leucyl aminopeptidase
VQGAGPPRWPSWAWGPSWRWPGAEEPLRFIELRYHGAAKTQAPVVLVGKGITFDTGGISLKPAPEMDEMKFDMGGAASVLGVFRALAELQPAINVVGLIPPARTCPTAVPSSRAMWSPA